MTMRKKLRRVFALTLLFAVVAGFCVLLSSCGNYRLEVIPAEYDWAELRTASGDLIVGPVSKWSLFSTGTLSVTINGIDYLTHACNVTLMTEKP